MKRYLCFLFMLVSLMSCKNDIDTKQLNITNPLIGTWYSAQSQFGFELLPDSSLNFLLPDWNKGVLVDAFDTDDQLMVNVLDSTFDYQINSCTYGVAPFHEITETGSGQFTLTDTLLIMNNFLFDQTWYEFERIDLDNYHFNPDPSTYSALITENEIETLPFEEIQIGMLKSTYLTYDSVTTMKFNLESMRQSCILQDWNSKTNGNLYMLITDFVGVGEYDLLGTESHYSTGSGLLFRLAEVANGKIEITEFDFMRRNAKGTFSFSGTDPNFDFSVELTDGVFDIYW